ncbi:DNA-3-methyladenine glycosylase II [Motilibacter rhizosphaerae]|uniref:DNA-3-methyladenine glycosylase II n=1 Tax=Motilibacter rhizosphaerae TaxID=598652 RepID=A0A4Q7NBT4_9ACTN|nr:DNA-3-methyladenine glycosylase [Motilibacter rhizosphaerae]RZS80077.1 DNA-3-methyladenine glycosylase II [Motilibacter rhizosphaerae]
MIVLPASGPFSLAAAAAFWSGFPAGSGDGRGAVLELAFPAPPGWGTVAVRLVEDAAGVGVDVLEDGGLGEGEVARQVAQVLCLDVDGSGFGALGERDPVVADLQRGAPGLRPVLFATPYEAAAWTVIGNRVRQAQASALRRRMAEQLGVRVTASSVPAFPPPAVLAGLDGFPGLPDPKPERLRALGRAALDGVLDRDRLRALGREEAVAELLRLPGIGPFSAELVWVRGVGDPDALPTSEPRLQAAVRAAYGLGEGAGPDELQRVAESWRPYRSWVALLLRARAGAQTSGGRAS